ncbi:hemolysin family protein [Ornithinibacillus californiensis]|uniref:hemolysin family protein n=1 Tax=Ornithinibacillus californiensis TaxID=161536 RepID=UPI00064D9964|nr:hemolysin family protein [Ornithinibacillus californiensis]
MDIPLVSIGIVLILIVANGIFAMTEIAIVTSRKARLDKIAENGDKRASYALKLAEEPNQLLSTIQIGITLIGVVTGAFGGAAIASQLTPAIAKIESLAPFSSQISLFIVIAITTYLSLIIGELVPKRIGMNNPEKVALSVAKPMYYFSKVGKPLIWVLSKSTEFVLKIFGIKQNNDPDVTEEEITQLIEQGVYSGVVEENEREMVEKIFYMGDQRLGDILTPRTYLEWIDLEDPQEENLEIMNTSNHSSFPVGEGSLDNIRGIIHKKNVFGKLLKNEPFQLEDVVEKALVLPEAMMAFQALEKIKDSGKHQAIVIDEYGGIEGFVTLHDFIEVIVGDMPDLFDVDPKIVKRDEKTWLADGLIPLETFRRYFEIDEFEELRSESHTLGGYITTYLGDIPKVGDFIQVEDLKIEVVDMDHVRVDKVMVTRVELDSGE